MGISLRGEEFSKLGSGRLDMALRVPRKVSHLFSLFAEAYIYSYIDKGICEWAGA